MAMLLPRKQEFKADPSFGQMLKEGFAQTISQGIPAAGLSMLGKWAQDEWQAAREAKELGAQGQINVEDAVNKTFAAKPGAFENLTRDAAKITGGGAAPKDAAERPGYQEESAAERLIREGSSDEDRLVQAQMERAKGTADFLESPEVKAAERQQNIATKPTMADLAAASDKSGILSPVAGGPSGGTSGQGGMLSPLPGMYRSKVSSKTSGTNPQIMEAALAAVEPDKAKYDELYGLGLPTQGALENRTQYEGSTMDRIVADRLKNAGKPDYAAYQRMLNASAATTPQMANATTGSRSSMAGLVGESSKLTSDALGAGKYADEMSEEYRQGKTAEMLKPRGGGGGGGRRQEFTPAVARAEASDIKERMNKIDEQIKSLPMQTNEYGQPLVGDSPEKVALLKEKAALQARRDQISKRFQEVEGYELGETSLPSVTAGAKAGATAGARLPYQEAIANLNEKNRERFFALKQKIESLDPRNMRAEWMRLKSAMDKSVNKDDREDFQKVIGAVEASMGL